MSVCGQWAVYVCGLSLCGVYIDAGAGSLEVSVEAAGSTEQPVKASVSQQSDELYLVQYTPLTTGPHTVSVFYAGQHVNHSPFTVHVKPRQYPPTTFSLSLSLSVCLSVCLSVTPLTTGPHTVNVYYAGQHVNHSPFTVHVKPGAFYCFPPLTLIVFTARCTSA